MEIITFTLAVVLSIVPLVLLVIYYYVVYDYSIGDSADYHQTYPIDTKKKFLLCLIPFYLWVKIFIIKFAELK